MPRIWNPARRSTISFTPRKGLACSATPRPRAWKRSVDWECWCIRGALPSNSGPASNPKRTCSTIPPGGNWRAASGNPACGERLMTLPLARNIYFTGFMASGKSRIGSLTAASLGWKFFDIDKLIEEKTGKTVPRIFAEDGEPAFRRMEVEALREVGGQGPMVASLGGGTLLNPEAIELIRGNGVLVGLH